MAYQPSANIKTDPTLKSGGLKKDMQLMKKVGEYKSELQKVFDTMSNDQVSAETKKMIFEAIKELNYALRQFEQDLRGF